MSSWETQSRLPSLLWGYFLYLAQSGLQSSHLKQGKKNIVKSHNIISYILHQWIKVILYLKSELKLETDIFPCWLHCRSIHVFCALMAMLYFSAHRRGVSSEFDGFRCRRLVDSFLTHAQERLKNEHTIRFWVIECTPKKSWR